MAGSVTPRLVVEILSASNRLDYLAVKRDLYQRLGVRAYWLVDRAGGPSLTALRLRGASYQVEAELRAPEVFETDWPYPVRIPLDGLDR